MNRRLSKTFGIMFLIIELAIVPQAVNLMLDLHLSTLPPMRILGIAITFGSIELCILMLFASMGEHRNYPKQTFLFQFTIFMCGLAPVTEFFSQFLDGTGQLELNIAINTFYYLLCINMAFVLMLYEFSIIDIDKNPKLKKTRSVFTALIVFDNIATFLNIRFGYFFTITEDGSYQSSSTFWLAYIVPLIIVISIAVIADKNIPSISARRAFRSFWIFAFIASSVQMWQEYLTVQYTGFTLSLVVIYLNIQCELDSICLLSSGVGENVNEDQ